MKQTLILLILLLLPLITCAYQENGFTLYGNPEDGWVFITPDESSFTMWIGEDLGTIAIEKGTEWRLTTCILIRNGKQDECSLREFSILFYNFPKEFITSLGI